jgi:phosphoglycolate phosphatase-like HAD superfamily hydrolase
MSAAVKARAVRFIGRFSHCDNGSVSTYILWDIDGTLILNNSQGGALYVDSIEHVTGVRPTERVAAPHGMTEGQLLAAILEVNGQDASHIDAVLERLDVLSLEAHEAGDVREPTPGGAAAIAEFAARGWINALLTGNGPKRARYKLVAAGYDADDFDWGHSYFGHQSPTRHHLTADARTGLDGKRAVIIGDTPKDGEAADTAEIPFIAVATGAYTSDELRETNAIVVVEDLVSGREAVLDAISRLK